MYDHNEEGAFGLILTRPNTNIHLGDICESISDSFITLPSPEILKAYPLYLGGPVQTTAIFFLHDCTWLGEEAVKGACLGTQVEDLQQILQSLETNSPARLRAFQGYSGWGPGQLESELEAGGWLIRPADSEAIFETDPKLLWGKLLKSFGGDLGILGDMPLNPELN